LPGAEGCKWKITFDDGTTNIIAIPEDYIGPNDCEFSSSLKYNSNDAIQVATYNLLKSFDTNNNDQCDIKFSEQNLVMNFSHITGIPFSWSTEIQIRRWR
jgi:hypothetical protein